LGIHLVINPKWIVLPLLAVDISKNGKMLAIKILPKNLANFFKNGDFW